MKLEMKGLFPLWGVNTSDVATSFIDLGFKLEAYKNCRADCDDCYGNNRLVAEEHAQVVAQGCFVCLLVIHFIFSQLAS